MNTKKVSQHLLKRLSAYLFYLKSLPDSVVHISATSIAKALALGDVQVRKDLARVSDGGQRRIGHLREQLIRDIESFLDFSAITGAVVVCSEKLGQLLVENPGFEQYGLKIHAGFTLQPAKGDTSGANPLLPISLLESFCRVHDIRIGIIAVSEEDAQTACDKLLACGIRAIWNFAPVRLTVPKSVAIHNESLTNSAAALRIQLEISTREQPERG